MQIQITSDTFNININDQTPQQRLLQDTFYYTYSGLLKGTITDPELTNLFFNYFKEDPVTRFNQHYREINYEEIYERNQFWADEEEAQGFGTWSQPQINDPIVLIEEEEQEQEEEEEEENTDSEDSESTTQIDSDSEDGIEIFITLEQLRGYREPRYWTETDSDSEFNYVYNEFPYDSDASLPYSADLDSD